MHPSNVIDAALAQLASGLSASEVSRRMGVPRRTVADWGDGRVPRRAGRFALANSRCHVCLHAMPQLDGPAYAYLLGLYLGDGCISRSQRTFRLRIMLDRAYPGIVVSCAGAMEATRYGQRAWVRQRGSTHCIEVSMYSNHWPCLFPQHGPGKKHERAIRLVPWQETLVAEHRKEFVRGLIHSDGCRVVANDRGRPSVRYHFSNLSQDIKNLYCEALDALGVHWTRPRPVDVAVYRKASVAILDDFVGPKA